jgi:hypothetical protein
MNSPVHPASIRSLERNKHYHVSHRGRPLTKLKVIADMHEALPNGGTAGGVMVVYSHAPYRYGFIAAGDSDYKFYSKNSPRRSSSRRRSSHRSASRRVTRRTKSAPRQKQQH